MPEDERAALLERNARKYEYPDDEAIDMEDTMDKKYQELRAKITEVRKTMKDMAKGLFNEISAEIFKENPNLQSFSWIEYTPYWNDGDICQFSAHTHTVTFKTDEGRVVKFNENTGECTDSDDMKLNSDDYQKDINSLTKKVSKFLSVFEAEDLEMLFGDHVQVTVYAGGIIETEEYDHE